MKSAPPFRTEAHTFWEWLSYLAMAGGKASIMRRGAILGYGLTKDLSARTGMANGPSLLPVPIGCREFTCRSHLGLLSLRWAAADQ